jgi:hypothetical protein
MPRTRPTRALLWALIVALACLAAVLFWPGRAGAVVVPVAPGVDRVFVNRGESHFLADSGIMLRLHYAQLGQPVFCAPSTDDPAGPQHCVWIVVGPCRVVEVDGVAIDDWWDGGRCLGLPLVSN